MHITHMRAQKNVFEVRTAKLSQFMVSPKNHGYLFCIEHFFHHFLACTVIPRHLLLRNSLGTMEIEEDAFFTIWLTLGLVTMFFIIGPIFSCYLFKWANSSLHLSYEIVADEVEKEKAEKKKCCC